MYGKTYVEKSLACCPPFMVTSNSRGSIKCDLNSAI